jgi:hypothetical protein
MDTEDTLCDTFPIGKSVFDQFTKTQPERFIKLSQTDNYPNYGLIGHPIIQLSDL